MFLEPSRKVHEFFFVSLVEMFSLSHCMDELY